MQTSFSLEINNIPLEVISMSVTGPKLFQVFTKVDGKPVRFHMQGDGKDTLSFVLPEECPDFLLAIEGQIREKIFEMAKSK